MAKNTFTDTDHIYLQVAGGVEKMIQDDVLKIGDKLPSVRVLSEEYGISMGTAFQAYYHLEGKGLIESRPKSGYYVRFSPRRFRDLPRVIQPDILSHNVSVKEMIASFYSDIATNNERTINFALAVPHVSLLPAAKLNKAVTHVLRNQADATINYEHTQGNAELRKQIARQSFNWGGKIKADDVLVTSGCMEGLTLCLRAVTKPGDVVAVESPNYFGIFQAIENLGLKVVEISSDPTTGLDLDCLRRTLRKSPVKACVVIPNFNNPLGGCIPDAQKKELVELLTARNIPLIEDDIYGELYFGKNRPRTCKYYDRAGIVMHCSSFSKSLAPGYRIGWVLPGRYMEEVKQLKRILSISSPGLTQAAVAHYLQHGRFEYHLKNLRTCLHAQMQRYMQGIVEHMPDDTKVSRPQGGVVLWVELNKKIDSFRLRTEAMKQQILIMPGKIFSASCNYNNCIRISFGRPWDDQAEHGLQVLGRLIRKML
ncbi:MAG: PLP-dependent aminotransferase family protein [Chitinophagaceae bacterium]